MLTLDQVRAVNDGFLDGDLNAALRPLEETIDLRSNELPRLDKASLARLKADLSQGEVAATWAEAVFHPNISVRRFARRVFMGLGDEAAPLAEPLRRRIERFWNEETPLEWSTKPREAAARREQNEALSSALELLLRSDPEAFMAFWAQLLDASQPRQSETAQEARAWQGRATKAAEAHRAEVDRLLKAEWGQEWLASDKRWKLPSRVIRELNDRAGQNPEVARLQAGVGEAPWQRQALQWQPAQLFAAALSPYLSDVDATGPTRRVAERVRPVLHEWFGSAFDLSRPAQEQRLLAGRLLGMTHPYGMWAWLGLDWTLASLPAPLMRVKAAMLDDINRALKAATSSLGLGRDAQTNPLAQLWVGLAQTLSNAIARRLNPYLSETKKPLPDSLSPQLLLDLADGLKEGKNHLSLVSALKGAATSLEKERAATSLEPPAVEPKPAPAPVAPKASETVLLPHDGLVEAQVQEIYKELGYTEEAQTRVAAEMCKVEDEMASPNDDDKVRLLVEPPPHPRDPNKIISRLPYWNVWTRRLGERAEELKASVWQRAAPQLWARYEDRLELYRRVETDPIEEKVEQKLTPTELKAWKTDRRREKRQLIATELFDISNILIRVEGLPAQLRLIELADRPSCRDLRDRLEQGLFAELERWPGQHNKVASPDEWSAWKLGEGWDGVLEKAEARLSEAKDEWRRAALERQLATGFYRRGQFDKFQRYAERPNAFPEGVAAAAVQFDDFPAWRLLLGVMDGWRGRPLATFWEAQLQTPQRRARALGAVLETLSATSNEAAAKTLLIWLASVKADELEPFASALERALESPLAPVKRWAMSALGSLKSAKWNRERAAEVAGEALWNENAGLAKDAAKFLAQLALQDAEVAPLAWESLCDATALENLSLCEAVWKALAQVAGKNKSLVLTEAARERLNELAKAQTERFSKFSKKFADK